MENIDLGEKICCVRWLQIQKTRPHSKFLCGSSTNRDTANILLAKVEKHSKTWKILTLEKKLVAQWRIDFLLTPLMAY
jgi:hypothetical protein